MIISTGLLVVAGAIPLHFKLHSFNSTQSHSVSLLQQRACTGAVTAGWLVDAAATTTTQQLDDYLIFLRKERHPTNPRGF